VFEGHGRYSKARTAKPRFSPLIDLSVSSGLTSGSQIARLVLETWAELNLFCLNCDCDALVRLAANTPVADFECGSCNTRYQVKGKDGRFGPTITGAAYAPLIEAVRSGRCPEYVLIEYDRRFSSVVFGLAVRGSSITEDRVVARAPLRAAARRAGWIGCNIRLEGLPRVSLVGPQFVDSSKVRMEWAAIT
jgi:type II restriction enzyme